MDLRLLAGVTDVRGRMPLFALASNDAAAVNPDALRGQNQSRIAALGIKTDRAAALPAQDLADAGRRSGHEGAQAAVADVARQRFQRFPSASSCSQ